jgi:hypothetical protein
MHREKSGGTKRDGQGGLTRVANDGTRTAGEAMRGMSGWNQVLSAQRLGLSFIDSERSDD